MSNIPKEAENLYSKDNYKGVAAGDREKATYMPTNPKKSKSVKKQGLPQRIIDNLDETIKSGPTEDDATAEMIKGLTEHMWACQREGKFDEADETKFRIAEMRQDNYDHRYQELVVNQSLLRDEFEDAHAKHYMDFNRQWHDEVKEIQRADQQALNELASR